MAILETEVPKAQSLLGRTLEASRKVRFGLANKAVKEANKKMLESYRINMEDKTRFDFTDPFFSFKTARESVKRIAREANGAAMFSALLKAGINNVANDWYQLTDTVYEQIVQVTPSTHAVEPYAPVARGSTPRRTPRGTPFKEVKLQAPADIQIANEKFGAISAVEKELIDDDQTGQIMQRLQDIGPNMALLEEAWVMGKFISPSGGTTYQGDIIPVSGTKPSIETSSTWPWSTALLGGGQNRPTSYTVFSNNLVQEADYFLMIQKDQNGNFMAVSPDTLLVGPGVKFPALTLMNSTWYPSTAAQLIGGGAVGTTATNLGTTYADNVMKGLYKPVVSRFLPSGAWAVGKAYRGMVFQMREGLSVIQENPTAEVSFDADELRFRAKARWMTEVIDMRFWFLGNDGTAT